MCEKPTNLILLCLTLILISTIAARAFDLSDPALIGYWPFNEGSGTVAGDLSESGNDGTLSGGVTWTDGMYGSGLHFDGSDGSVGTGQSILNDATGFTLAGWVSAGNADVYSSLFGQNDLVEFGFVGGNQVGTWLLGNNWQLVVADYPFEYPSWHHVALTGGPAGVVIYIDGQEAASDSGTVSSGSSGFAFNIGFDVFNTNGDPFMGEIDDVWVFSRILTPGEIQVLMQGSGGYPYALSPSPADGDLHLDTWITLRWRPGDSAISHDVYVSDNFDDVNDGTAGSSAFRGNQSLAFYLAGFPGYAYPDGLVPGATYYWRIDEVNEADPNSPWKGDVWSFFIPPKKAYEPSPADGAMFADPDVTLNWSPGMGARLHHVYFGDSFDEVDSAEGGLPQANVTYDPGTLELDKTYYWRVDQFDGIVPHKGDVWSFTTTIPGLGTAIAERWENISGDDLSVLKGYARFPNDPDVTEVLTQFSWNGPEADEYGGRIHGWLYVPVTGDYTFWINSDNQGELWLSTDDDSGSAVLIAQESGWLDFNAWGTGEEQSDPIPLVGGERYYIMALWKEGSGGDHCQAAWQGPGVSTRMVIPGSNLSPYEPVEANGPRPGNLATGITQTPILTWKPGIHAASHELYFGADEQAVANATKTSPEYIGDKALGDESHDPGQLPWETTYYWRVDEVNAVNPDSPWSGKVWSFTTAGFLIIDDFEDYNTGDNQIWESWLDGLGFGSPGTANYFAGNGTGAAVGDETTGSFAEETIIHGGRQSIPVSYDNNKQGYAKYSETEKTLATAPDWTVEGVTRLSLWFHGDPANSAERLYVTVSNSTGAAAVVVHPDPDATATAAWTEWVIPLSAFADQGVNLTNVDKIAIGLGDKGNMTTPGGSGKMYFDDIRLYRPNTGN